MYAAAIPAFSGNCWEIKREFSKYKTLCYTLIKSGRSFANFQNGSIFQVYEEGEFFNSKTIREIGGELLTNTHSQKQYN